MPSFKITLAYDGTDYVGWQRQPTGTSVQGLLEDALRAFGDRDVAVAGAGRTDAGVHALGQSASFALDRDIEPETLVRALNAKLPADVRVIAAAEVAPAFHARFDARSKSYRYRIANADVVAPFDRRYAWHVPGPLDREAMDRAARLLEGTHDFSVFQGAGSDAATAERTITSSRIVECAEAIEPRLLSDPHSSLQSKGQSTIQSTIQSAIRNPKSKMICYCVSGDGFLRHMVRGIVGTLVEVGRGRRDADGMSALIASRDRAQAGRTAPPEGLFLVSVDYVQ